jgi:hypothetical protein
MNTDPLEELGQGSLTPDLGAHRQAWQAARETFADACVSHHRIKSRWRFLTPVTSIAALFVACAALWVTLHRDPRAGATHPTPLSNASLGDFFIQGRELFGSQLMAVTVINGQPTWQLAETNEESISQPQPVIAIARITDPQGELVQVAALPGMPVKIPFGGRELQVEFLPTGNDQLLVTGPSLVWSSDQGSSPISSPSITALPR